MPREKKQRLKKRKDGRYRTKYQGKMFYGNTEAEALALRKEYKDAIESGDFIEDSMTVYEYAYNWLPVHKASVAPNTYKSYSGYLNKLCSVIGNRPMKDIIPSDIKEVYNLYLGQSASQIRKARMLYVDMWDCAIEDRIVKTNPCRSKAAAPHEGTSGTHRALSKEEDDLILACPADLRLAVLLMRYAGLRRGEVMAFDIDRDVDFDRKIIKISRAIHFEGNRGIMSDPKTEAGKREIPLLDILEKELKGHHGPVCPMTYATTMTRSIWRNTWLHYLMQLELCLNQFTQKRWYHRTKDYIAQHPDEWRKYLRIMKQDPEKAEEYRLRGWETVSFRPHDLRHSFCTMLRDNGVDIKLAILWMGHADEKMILRIYDHPPEERVRKAVENLNQSLIGVQNGGQGRKSVSGSVDL
jgi:integrase